LTISATRDWVGASTFCQKAKLVIVFDLTHAVAYKGHHKIWESDRIAWDGIRSISEVDDVICGEGGMRGDGTWVRFKLDPQNGKHTGGGFFS
jgi:hypothetical protein